MRGNANSSRERGGRILFKLGGNQLAAPSVLNHSHTSGETKIKHRPGHRLMAAHTVKRGPHSKCKSLGSGNTHSQACKSSRPHTHYHVLHLLRGETDPVKHL